MFSRHPKKLADYNGFRGAIPSPKSVIIRINESWLLLTGRGQGQLAWSPVIASKTLHFFSRSVGFEHDPPVAIDNAVILKLVWPYLRDMIPINQRPQGWRGKDLESYLRYMTVINIWAQQHHWTTTQMEATIFAVFRNNAQRIRIDCVSVANHNLILLLDEPDIGTQLAIRKYLF